MLPKAKAIESALLGGVRRVHVVSYKATEGILGEVFTNEGSGTLIVADVNALTAAEQQSTPGASCRHVRRMRARELMTRLWDKGAPLDERVLRYTAGEDHLLDRRLLQYDARASIAHARMLAQQGLLAIGDAERICVALAALADEHARGLWQIELADEDGQTALERRLTERIGAAGGRVHLGRSRNDQVLTAIRLYLRDVVRGAQCRCDPRCRGARCARVSARRARRCPVTRTCSRPCRAR